MLVLNWYAHFPWRCWFSTMPHCIYPYPLMLMIGDMMGGIMGRIFGENKNSKNSEKTADYENRPVKFVMERKNVWRVVWAD